MKFHRSRQIPSIWMKPMKVGNYRPLSRLYLRNSFNGSSHGSKRIEFWRSSQHYSLDWNWTQLNESVGCSRNRSMGFNPMTVTEHSVIRKPSERLDTPENLSSVMSTAELSFSSGQCSTLMKEPASNLLRALSLSASSFPLQINELAWRKERRPALWGR